MGVFKEVTGAPGRLSEWVKRPTLDFGSEHDLMVHEIDPHIRLCAESPERAWDSLSLSLSLSLSAPHPLVLSLCLSK